MSLDRKLRNAKRTVKKIGWGATAVGGGILVTNQAIHNGLDTINQRTLTPAAIQKLQAKTGASDPEIRALEQRLEQLMAEELKRMRDVKRR